MSGTRSNKKATTTPSEEMSDAGRAAASNKILELEEELARQKTATIVKDQKFLELEEELARQKTATTVQEKETGELKEIARQQIERNLDQQDIRAYTTYDDPETYHNMHTASIITVTGMNINCTTGKRWIRRRASGTGPLSPVSCRSPGMFFLSHLTRG